MKEDKTISALIGLVGACNNNPKTENTDRVIIKALAFPLTRILSAIQQLAADIYDRNKEDILSAGFIEFFYKANLSLYKWSPYLLIEKERG